MLSSIMWSHKYFLCSIYFFLIDISDIRLLNSFKTIYKYYIAKWNFFFQYNHNIFKYNNKRYWKNKTLVNKIQDGTLHFYSRASLTIITFSSERELYDMKAGISGRCTRSAHLFCISAHIFIAIINLLLFKSSLIIYYLVYQHILTNMHAHYTSLWRMHLSHFVLQFLFFMKAFRCSWFYHFKILIVL